MFRNKVFQQNRMSLQILVFLVCALMNNLIANKLHERKMNNFYDISIKNINGNNNNTTIVSTAIILKESLKIPKSYLIQSVDKDILRPEYFQHVQQPEYPMSLTLTRRDLNEKWENTTVKTM